MAVARRSFGAFVGVLLGVSFAEASASSDRTLPTSQQAAPSPSATTPCSGAVEKPAAASPDCDKPVPAGQRALAVGAALIPGAVIHGSGSWVLGDDATATRLLLLEGAGAGLIAGSLTTLTLTGAARSLAGPLAATTVAGAALVTLTLVADLYRVISPRQGFGTASPVPLFESRVGYASVIDPQFSHRNFVTHGVAFQPGHFRIGFEGWHAPWDYSRLRLDTAYRLWEATPKARRVGADQSFLALGFAGSQQQFVADGFTVTTYEVAVQHRLDLERVLPGIRGAFSDFNLGLARRSTRFTTFDVEESDNLLTGGFGFGAYLGHHAPQGGEFLLYYQHRHDELAGGAKIPGILSGEFGYFGTHCHYYLSEHWGLDVNAELGAAWVLGAGLRVRSQGAQ